MSPLVDVLQVTDRGVGCAAAKEAAAVSTLAQLLDAEPQQIPGIIQQLLQPFASPFAIPQRQLPSPLQVHHKMPS